MEAAEETGRQKIIRKEAEETGRRRIIGKGRL